MVLVEGKTHSSMEQDRKPRSSSKNYSQLAFGKGARAINGGKIVFSTNDDGTIRHMLYINVIWYVYISYNN